MLYEVITQCRFDKTGFIQRIGMDRHLYIVAISNAQAIIDRCRGSSPVFMQFQANCTCGHLFDQRASYNFV